MKRNLSDWCEGLMQLFFPVQCLGCGNDIVQADNYFCLLCMHKWPFTKFEHWEENPVEKIFRGRAEIRNAMACCFFNKGSGIQQLLHLLKYKHEKTAALFMGKMMAKTLSGSSLYAETDLIIPVPMFKSKERLRGYNQAALLGKALSDEWPGKKFDASVLIKHTQTDSQTRKSRLERWLNMKSRFSLSDPDAVSNKHILLVDDVITTGATLESCVHTLFEGKPASVSIAAYAWAATVL
ncbi:MAG: ComF family protein [Chitinophagaceae bacterium]